MTYSIVARDAATGALGVAVQSHYFSVGAGVPWIEAGVGAVATQAMADESYGPLGLALMRGGKPAGDALYGLLTIDPQRELRQVAMVDNAGRVAAHTGNRCIAHASHLTGEGVSVQANIMERDTVPAVMLQAYQAATGDLAERLLAALDAAEGQGGDARGRQAAALMIEGGPLRMDCRIDDHPDPLKELRRLVGLRRAYFRSSHALELLQQGEVAQGMTELAGLRGEHPTNPEFAFWYGAVMAAAGSVEQGRAALLNCYAANPRWLLVLDRVAAAGLIPLEPSVLSQLRP